MNETLGARRALANAAAAVTFAAFVALFVALALSRPLCCADDAAHAVIAKNLALGYGYANTLGHNTPVFAFQRFDPVIGTGPTVILPAAAAIFLFGNYVEVPGLTSVVVWSILLVVLYVLVRRLAATPVQGGAAAASFLLLCLVLSPFNAPEWFALLGEVPVTLLVLIAYATFVLRPSPPAGHLWVGALLGLAILGKLLSTLYLVPVAVATVVGAVASQGRRDRASIACLFLGVAIPLVVFEFWKVASLGGKYVESVQAAWRFVTVAGLDQGAQPVVERLASRLAAFNDRYGVPLPPLLLAVAASGAIVVRSGNRSVRKLYMLGAAGCLIHVGYWLLASAGNPRYIFGAMVVMAALVSMAWLVPTRPIVTFAFLGFVVALMAVPAKRVPMYRDLLSTQVRSGGAAAAEAAAAFLERERRGRVVLTQWWATAAAMEFASREIWIFDGYSEYPRDLAGSGTLLAYSEHFVNKGDKAFAELVQACGAAIFSAPPFKIHRC